MARTYLESGRQRVNTDPATLTSCRLASRQEMSFELWLPTRERMPAIAGYPAVIAVAAAIIIGVAAVVGRAAIIDRPTAIVAVGVIVVGTAVGGGAGNAGADDARKEGHRVGAATAAIRPATGAEIGRITRARGGCQTLFLGRRPGDSQRRLDHRQRQRRHRGQGGGAANRRKQTRLREHLNVLRGSRPYSRPLRANHRAHIGFPNPNAS